MHRMPFPHISGSDPARRQGMVEARSVMEQEAPACDGHSGLMPAGHFISCNPSVA
jgi:hypothetical protein